MFRDRSASAKKGRHAFPTNRPGIKCLAIVLISIVCVTTLMFSVFFPSSAELEPKEMAQKEKVLPQPTKDNHHNNNIINEHEKNTKEENNNIVEQITVPTEEPTPPTAENNYNNNNDIDDNNAAEQPKCVKTFRHGSVVTIVGMPRSGSTLLFNIARLLVELEDPNTISGYEPPVEDVYYWSSNNISVVIKAHDMFKTYINPLKGTVSSINGMYRAPAHAVLSDYVLYSRRDLGSAMCSLYRLGWVEESTVKRRCSNMISMNRTVYRKLKAYKESQKNPDGSKRPAFFEPFTFDEITKSRESMEPLIQSISTMLGLCSSPEKVAWVEAAVKALKPIALPSGDSRSAQNPRTLLHSKHTATSTKLNNVEDNVHWDCTPVYEAMKKLPSCKKVYLAEIAATEAATATTAITDNKNTNTNTN